MKKKLILTTIASVLTIGAVSGAVALTSKPQNSGADTTPISSTLQQQQDELNNHEARITNNESNISALGDKTGTNTTTVVQVPAPATQTTPTAAPATTPAPSPVTVTAYEQIPIDSNNIDCKLTYSDGTTYQWHWKVAKGNISYTAEICDSSIIGTPKH